MVFASTPIRPPADQGIGLRTCLRRKSLRHRMPCKPGTVPTAKCGQKDLKRVLALHPDGIVSPDIPGIRRAPAIRQTGPRVLFLPAYPSHVMPGERVFARLRHPLRKAASRRWCDRSPLRPCPGQLRPLPRTGHRPAAARPARAPPGRRAEPDRVFPPSVFSTPQTPVRTLRRATATLPGRNPAFSVRNYPRGGELAAAQEGGRQPPCRGQAPGNGSSG
jgi:hypothetical protein